MSKAPSGTETLGAAPPAAKMYGAVRLGDKLGEGGMGIVYRGYHTFLKKDVVVKLIREELLSRQDVRERFLNEARLAAKITAPEIVQVHNCDVSEGRLYIVMEFMPKSTASSTTPSTTRHRRSKTGSPLTHGSSSTSRPRMVPGSTRSSCGFSSSLPRSCVEACSIPRMNYTRRLWRSYPAGTAIPIGSTGYTAPSSLTKRSFAMRHDIPSTTSGWRH